MQLLLVALCVIPIMYLGYIMSRLDDFTASGGFDTHTEDVDPTALVIGTTSLAQQTAALLEAGNVRTVLLEGYSLGENGKFDYLFALSENDIDNILICRIGREMYSIKHLVAVCGGYDVERIFQREHLPYILRGQATPERIVRIVLLGTEEDR